mmetsp:Transcript_65034/g.211940  ORF Transcript_65034/g.211940 Transcript_65034/m.211940 type:complete len:469 (+) Transcript_65034:467-1873(+)
MVAAGGLASALLRVRPGQVAPAVHHFVGIEVAAVLAWRPDLGFLVAKGGREALAAHVGLPLDRPSQIFAPLHRDAVARAGLVRRLHGRALPIGGGVLARGLVVAAAERVAAVPRMAVALLNDLAWPGPVILPSHAPCLIALVNVDGGIRELAEPLTVGLRAVEVLGGLAPLQHRGRLRGRDAGREVAAPLAEVLKADRIVCCVPHRILEVAHAADDAALSALGAFLGDRSILLQRHDLPRGRSERDQGAGAALGLVPLLDGGPLRGRGASCRSFRLPALRLPALAQRQGRLLTVRDVISTLSGTTRHLWWGCCEVLTAVGARRRREGLAALLGIVLCPFVQRLAPRQLDAGAAARGLGLLERLPFVHPPLLLVVAGGPVEGAVGGHASVRSLAAAPRILLPLPVVAAGGLALLLHRVRPGQVAPTVHDFIGVEVVYVLARRPHLGMWLAKGRWAVPAALVGLPLQLPR